VFGDFNRLDQERRVRLDTAGSREDLGNLGDELKVGAPVVVDSGDFEAPGSLEYEGGIWRARIVWEKAKDKSEDLEGDLP
jgi:hypothetical protein